MAEYVGNPVLRNESGDRKWVTAGNYQIYYICISQVGPGGETLHTSFVKSSFNEYSRSLDLSPRAFKSPLYTNLIRKFKCGA
jgi:hypothetical protein